MLESGAPLSRFLDDGALYKFLNELVFSVTLYSFALSFGIRSLIMNDISEYFYMLNLSLKVILSNDNFCGVW